MNKLKQQGFTVIEGLLIGFIVLAIVGIGYIVYQRQSSSNAATAESDAAFQKYVDEQTPRETR